MAETLRHLVIQRAARLQARPALQAESLGQLSYLQLRNRVEGVALGLMAKLPPLGRAVFSTAEGGWAWIGELAAACCGLVWDPRGELLDGELFGGPRFNAEAGRQPYHDREEEVRPDTPFQDGLDHGELLLRLRRLNVRLGWDHRSGLRLPLSEALLQEGRAALWSALYAGASVKLQPTGAWDSAPFRGLLEG